MQTKRTANLSFAINDLGSFSPSPNGLKNRIHRSNEINNLRKYVLDKHERSSFNWHRDRPVVRKFVCAAVLALLCTVVQAALYGNEADVVAIGKLNLPAEAGALAVGENVQIRDGSDAESTSLSGGNRFISVRVQAEECARLMRAVLRDAYWHWQPIFWPVYGQRAWNAFAEDNRGVNTHHASGRVTQVLKLDLNDVLGALVASGVSKSSARRNPRQDFREDICALKVHDRARAGLGGFGGLVSRFCGASGLSHTEVRQNHSGEKANSSNGGQHDSPSGNADLRLSRAGGGLLGYEVFVLTLLGVLFSLFAVRGVLFALDNPNTKGLLYGGPLILLGLTGCTTFYGWAAFGSPLRFWLGTP